MVHLSGNEVETLDSKSVILKDLTGMKVEEADKYIAELNKEGWEIVLETDKNYIYSADEKMAGTIYSQSVEASTDLTDEKSVQRAGLQIVDKKVSGTIACTVYRSDKIYYREIRNLNAYGLAKKLGRDINKDKTFVKAKDKNGGNYYDIKSIVIQENGKERITYSPDEFENAYKGGELPTQAIQEICYYASYFYYWDKLPDFAGRFGTIDKLKKERFRIYKRDNKNVRKMCGRRTLSDNLIDYDSYCTFNKNLAGKIVNSNQVQIGKSLDTSEGLDKLVYVVKANAINYEGKTVKQAEGEIREKWPNCKVDGDEKGKVAKITVYDANGKEVSYFKKGELGLRFVLTAEEKAPIATKSTVKPSVQPQKSAPKPTSTPPVKVKF